MRIKGRDITDRERYAFAAFLHNEHETAEDAAAYYGADTIAVELLIEHDATETTTETRQQRSMTMTNKTNATLTAADAVREAIRRLAEDGTTTVTAKDVQPVAAKLSPAVKDGYASFYLAAFAREGSVHRVSRGTYDTTTLSDRPKVETGPTQAELEDMTKAEIVLFAKAAGIPLKNVKNTKKDGLIEQLMAR